MELFEGQVRAGMGVRCEIENRGALASFINEEVVEMREWLVAPYVKGKATKEQDKETITSPEKGGYLDNGQHLQTK